MPSLPSAKDQATRYSFGSTSAIITTMALIAGLDATQHAKTTIIGTLFIIGLADNISDTLGIHIFQESEGLSPRAVWLSTVTNFLTRFLTVFIFIGIIYFFPISVAVPASVILGLLILSFVSYVVARRRRLNPVLSIAEHLVIALLVVLASHAAQRYILLRFGRI